MVPAGLLAKEIEARFRIPYVVTEHSTGYARGTIRPRQLEIARTVARAAKMRMGVSQPLCELLRVKLGVEAGPWQEMPNIVAQRFLDHPLHQRPVSDGSFRFVCVASLSKKKGFDDLLVAFAQQFQTDEQVTLDIGGAGAEVQHLMDLTERLGIQNRVRFLGALNREKVLEVMTNADAFVLASHYETFGVVVIEALALGKPVIATRCGGPETIVREKDGLLVPVGEIDALAAAMQELRTNFIRYEAEEIRGSCATRYSEKIVVERLTSVYCEVLANTTRD